MEKLSAEELEKRYKPFLEEIVSGSYPKMAEIETIDELERIYYLVEESNNTTLKALLETAIDAVVKAVVASTDHLVDN